MVVQALAAAFLRRLMPVTRAALPTGLFSRSWAEWQEFNRSQRTHELREHGYNFDYGACSFCFL
jgi:hypothetical protein